MKKHRDMFLEFHIDVKNAYNIKAETNKFK